MLSILRAARALGLELCPSVTRRPGILAGVLYYRPSAIASTRRQLARILARYLRALSKR